MFNTFTTLKSLCWWARTVEVAILTAFQSLLWKFYSHIFLLSFWSGSYFHNCYWPLSSWVSVATDRFLTKALRPGFSWRSSSELHSGQVTTMKQGSSRELDNRSNRDNALGMGFFFFEVPQTSPAHPVVASLLLFKVTADLSKERWEQFKLQCHKPCSMRLSSFSWINTPQIVGSLWLISRVLK